MSTWQRISTEARAMFALALPVVADQIGMMSMSFVDTIMVGQLGPQSLGAVGIASSVYFTYMVFAYGTIAAIGPSVAQAFGAGDPDEIARSVGQGAWLTLGLVAVGLLIAWNLGPILNLLGQQRELIPLSESYARALGFGMLGTLLFAVLRAFLMGLGRTRVTMVISICASLLNAGLNYVLIYGKLGMPALGVAGSGYATAIVQWCMFGAALYYVLTAAELREYPILRRVLPINPRYLGRLLRLGVPIGAGNSMEVGLFSLTSLFMGQIGTIALASHQVALNVASLTFMIPLGISTAVTTRVGQAIGRGEPRQAELSGWVGIALAAACMSLTAILFVAIPEPIIGIYTQDERVLAYATSLLLIAGAFQIFDGIQVAAMGALRGMKDTARPMVVNLISYWCIGVPTGYSLAFLAGLEGPGLWWGLTAGLAAAAILHSFRFRRLTRTFGAGI